jgi:maltose phosphorylase
MKQYYTHHDWKIIEESFQPSMHEASESIFSIGNGKMGQRANFEEQYSGKTLQGTYIAGIYYPDKTRVGWWKNGYPEYFAKVLNAPNWIGLDIEVNGNKLDLHQCRVSDFKRVLDMQHSILERTFTAELSNGKKVQVEAERFVSITHDEYGLIRYRIRALQDDTQINVSAFIDGNVRNKDSNYDELFWERIGETSDENFCSVSVKTKKTGFHVTAGFTALFQIDNGDCIASSVNNTSTQFTSQHASFVLNKNQQLSIYKYCSVVSDLYYPAAELTEACAKNVQDAVAQGYEQLKKAHCAAWLNKWELSDIQIEGDTGAQQGIRFNILQLQHTYTGKDPRLNIGPKGFTGEKYGGSTYWDTEAYCIPFYLGTSPSKVARQLLVYRYKQLDKAIENAAKLGFSKGAALFPMVTMNGEECHNEWEITFEEIHRNGAIAYAIWNYTQYTGDESYLQQGGAEVLIAIARFWAQRVNLSPVNKKYMILGVTGPNEYENNVNNNWYTNYIAQWCMRYANSVVHQLKTHHPDVFQRVLTATSLKEVETADWLQKAENMYLPKDKQLNIFLQQDGYMDKEQQLAAELDPSVRPINQHWSWDRILRSCFIKQADVLQGLFFFEHEFDRETLRRNFDFYEPRTVHESSLSPCVHAIQAARLGYQDKAYELYLRTSRLDLDDYNKEVHEGLHITSMAGTWMSVVMGFGGMYVRHNMLHFQPALPKQWKKLSFKVSFRERLLQVTISTNNTISITLLKGDQLEVKVKDTILTLQKETTTEAAYA